MNTLYLDIFSGISGDMLVAALVDLGAEAAHLEAELRRLPVTGYHLHVCRQAKAGIAGVKFDVHLDADSARHADPGHAPGSAQATARGDGKGPEEAAPSPPLLPPAHGQHLPHTLTAAPALDPNPIPGSTASVAQAHAPAQRHEHEHAHPHGHERDDDYEQGHDHHHGHGPGPLSGHSQPHRAYRDIRELIQRSELGDWVKQKALSVFARIARAEAGVHGIPVDDVHFHEVGAIDSIVDIVAACVALDALGRPRVLAAPVVEGTGFVTCAHGRFPVPAPATLAILGARGVAVTQCAEPGELVTPTGAALLAEFAESFGPMTGLVPTRIGYGLGTRNHQTRPNVLRAVLGSTAPAAPAGGRSSPDWETDEVAVLETNLDDCSPEVLGHWLGEALRQGALDAFITPVQMKKNRPGAMLTLLCAPGEADRMTEFMLRETTAFGVRRALAPRRKLRREFRSATTPWGDVVLKCGLLNGEVIQAKAEYDSCRRLAEAAGAPLQAIQQAAAQATREVVTPSGSATASVAVRAKEAHDD
jgi:hypothetical protein